MNNTQLYDGFQDQQENENSFYMVFFSYVAKLKILKGKCVWFSCSVFHTRKSCYIKNPLLSSFYGLLHLYCCKFQLVH